MTTAQKVIKYLAIAFAIFLIVTIISSIIAGITAFSGVLRLKKHVENVIGEVVSENIENNNISKLEIEIAFTNLTIKNGETLKIETNNNDIKYEQINNELKIKEKDKFLLYHEEKQLTLYLPENLELEKVKIATGAGKINIENINAEKLLLELGAGETEIQQINVSKECDVEGGAGKLDILSGTINDMDLDMGVGEVNLTANLSGKNEINAGIGNLNISLQGEKQSYKIQADKGIGSIKIDGNEISSGESFGDGENKIDVDGGIGNIEIKFENNLI